MPKLHQIIERHWQRPNPFLSFLLKPLIKVGIISRGYGRKSKAVHVLNAASRAEDAGDEPLLLFRKTGVPTAVGSSRAEAGRALLAAHPDIGLIVADDGLQHYALRRDVEIAVFPAADTGLDAVVVSGGKADASFAPSENMFHSLIETGQIYRLNHPSELLDTGRLKNQTVAAVAGIAKPERFFDSLRNMGITLNQTVALPDHADITAADLPNADAVIITEKDAVKFSDDLNLNHVWVLPVCAIIEPDLAAFVLERLKDSRQVV